MQDLKKCLLLLLLIFYNIECKAQNVKNVKKYNIKRYPVYNPKGDLFMQNHELYKAYTKNKSVAVKSNKKQNRKPMINANGVDIAKYKSAYYVSTTKKKKEKVKLKKKKAAPKKTMRHSSVVRNSRLNIQKQNTKNDLYTKDSLATYQEMAGNNTIARPEDEVYTESQKQNTQDTQSKINLDALLSNKNKEKPQVYKENSDNELIIQDFDIDAIINN